MRIGILGREQSGSDSPLDDCIADAGRAAAEGFATFWLPQAYGLDVMTTLAIVGREVEGIELGTAVLPIYARTPISLASAVLTTQAAVRGRFTLGVGLSHIGMVQASYGASFDHPIRDLREYLTALVPLILGEAVDVAGASYRVAGKTSVKGATATWTLYWPDRNRKFHRYEDLDPAARVDRLLAEIDADPTCIFWG